MPIHDWSRVIAGTFHDFHCAWIVEIRNVLNGGILPADYYAQAEQIAGDMGPDVLTLQSTTDDRGEIDSNGTTATLVAPPRLRFTATVERDRYAGKARTLVIRHGSDDRIVALLEIVSPGNKASRHAIRSLVDKAVCALARGYHLLLIDLHAPGPRDPQGIHGLVWAEVCDDTYQQPADKPLTLASYSAGDLTTAHIQPVAVGDHLPDMPLFLEAEACVLVPLEATCQAAYRGVPLRWRRVLEG